MDIGAAIAKALAPLRNRVVNMIARAVLNLTDDSKQIQIVQLQLGPDETRDQIERFQNYGFTSVPLAGAEAAVMFVGGRRDHGLAIAIDDRRYRITNLQGGEVAVYTDQGDSIIIKRGGTIQVTAATKVQLITPAVELAGNTNPVAQGDTLNTAIAALGTAIATEITNMGNLPAGAGSPILGAKAGTAGANITAAVGTFNSAAAAALSTKVKLT